jgi:hypothetical protein
LAVWPAVRYGVRVAIAIAHCRRRPCESGGPALSGSVWRPSAL